MNPAFNRYFLRYMAFAEDPGDAYDPLNRRSSALIGAVHSDLT